MEGGVQCTSTQPSRTPRGACCSLESKSPVRLNGELKQPSKQARQASDHAEHLDVIARIWPGTAATPTIAGTSFFWACPLALPGPSPHDRGRGPSCPLRACPFGPTVSRTESTRGGAGGGLWSRTLGRDVMSTNLCLGHC